MPDELSRSFTAERHVGRLLEGRIVSLRTLDDVDAYNAAFLPLIAACPRGQRPVLCADHRAVVIYPPVVADKLAAIFAGNNGRFERVALLVARTNATLAMQLERIVREAQNPHRRVFYAGPPAATFLGELLSATERARLSTFLGDGS